MMFSSPLVRPFSQENAENTISRKPGNHGLSRKPLMDRTINSKTPLKSPYTKQKHSLKNLKNEVLVTKNNSDEYICSYRNIEDDFSDIWPIESNIQQKVVRCINQFCYSRNLKTPPPVECNPTFFDMLESVPVPTNFMEDPANLYEEIEEVGIPHIDFDEFDDSI